MQCGDGLRGDCAWNSCLDQNCTIMSDENGRPQFLPACDRHKKYLDKFHSIYKNISNNYLHVDTNLLSNKRKFGVLRANCWVLLTEVKQRLNFTKNIKQLYRDEGHSFYIRSLIQRVHEIIKQLEDLKAQGLNEEVVEMAPFLQPFKGL